MAAERDPVREALRVLEERLHHGVGRDHGADRRRQLLGRHRAEAADQRGERRLLALLRRRGQRAVGAPVEGAVDREDLPALAVLARELDRRLVGLRA